MTVAENRPVYCVVNLRDNFIEKFFDTPSAAQEYVAEVEPGEPHGPYYRVKKTSAYLSFRIRERKVPN